MFDVQLGIGKEESRRGGFANQNKECMNMLYDPTVLQVNRK